MPRSCSIYPSAEQQCPPKTCPLAAIATALYHPGEPPLLNPYMAGKSCTGLPSGLNTVQPLPTCSCKCCARYNASAVFVVMVYYFRLSDAIKTSYCNLLIAILSNPMHAATWFIPPLASAKRPQYGHFRNEPEAFNAARCS